jgi:hypothetical protein
VQDRLTLAGVSPKFERGSFSPKSQIFIVNFKDFSQKGGRLHTRPPPGDSHALSESLATV